MKASKAHDGLESKFDERAIARQPLMVTPDTPVKEAIAAMQREAISDPSLDPLEALHRDARSSCVVVADAGQVVGLLTERDVVRLSLAGEGLGDRPISQVMTPPVLTLREAELTNVLSILVRLQREVIRHVPIVDEQDQVVGLLTCESLLATVLQPTGAETAPDELQIQPQVEADLQPIQQFQQQLDFLLASSPAIIYSCKPQDDYAFTYVSSSMETVLGYTQEEVHEPNFWATRVHPDDALWIFDELSTALETHGFYKGEYRFRHRDGQYVWIRDELRLIRDEQGRPAEIVGSTMDVSDRKQAVQLLQTQAQREQLKLEITQRIRQSLDLQTIFDTACQEIRQVLQADRVGIFKFYPESCFDDGEFVAESVMAGYTSAVHFPVHDHCFGENYAELYTQGRVFVVDDIYKGGLETCHSDILTQFQVRANLVVPLLCGAELWGLLCVHQCDGPRQWQPDEVELTHQLASQLAIAIQQADLYHQLQQELRTRQQAEAQIIQQLRQQHILARITERIRNSLNLDDVLAAVTQQVKEVMGCDRVIVFRLFPDGRSQIVEEAVNPGLAPLKNQHWEDEVWSPEILEVYWQGQPRIVPDVMDDLWTDCLRDYSLEGQIQSKIVAPILQEVPMSEQHRWVAPWSNDKLWGVLVVHACHEKRVWQQPEALLLQQIANQLAIAIQQANLFEQLQMELIQRQETQAQLTERNQELARATRLKDEFLANMSHELRTPLNAILGMTEGLQEGMFGAVNPSQLKALDTIEHSGNHLLSLINDILDVAKIESGQMELEYTTATVKQLCDSSLSFVKQQALKKRIRLESLVPKQLPDLYVDERRIRQVLINLLSNAVKFTPEGGHVTLEVSYRVRELTPADDDGMPAVLRFTITDTGIGISAENLDKLFQPFVQIDSALNRKHEGTGLGLVLVKRIVEMHGGEINLHSEEGVGSSFGFTLPLCDAVIHTEVASGSSDFSGEALLPMESGASPLILLAEDNEVNISTVATYLRAKGYRLILARDGGEAIALAQSEHPDLILMDIQMPGIDGLEAIQKIRQDASGEAVPIIALTALAMEGDRDRCLAAGANEYVSKPIKLKDLVLVIQQFFQRSSPNPPRNKM